MRQPFISICDPVVNESDNYECLQQAGDVDCRQLTPTLSATVAVHG